MECANFQSSIKLYETTIIMIQTHFYNYLNEGEAVANSMIIVLLTKEYNRFVVMKTNLLKHIMKRLDAILTGFENERNKIK